MNDVMMGFAKCREDLCRVVVELLCNANETIRACVKRKSIFFAEHIFSKR